MINKLFLILLLCVLLISCGSGSSTPTPQVEKQSLSLTYSFSESAQGFSIDTADYSVEHPQNDIIKSEMSDLPPPYEFRKGILYQWNNYSDDMKGYIKKKSNYSGHPKEKMSGSLPLNSSRSASLAETSCLRQLDM